MIRLPQQCADVIGETAHIFETEHEGEKAFLILLKNKETTKRKIIKEFIKSKPEIDLKTHLITLESKIEGLNKLILKSYNDNPDEKLKKDGLEEIRTPDLRRVKAMSLLALVRSFKAKPPKDNVRVE